MSTSLSPEPVNMLPYLTEGIKVADRIRVANKLTLVCGDKPRLSGWAQSNDNELKCGRERQKSQCQRDAM